MYRVVYEYADGRKGICENVLRGENKYAEFETEQEADAFASDLNGRIDDDVKHLFPVYRAEECTDESADEEPAPKINVKERIAVVRAMETVARAINREGIFETWLCLGVADGDIDESTTDEELMYYVESNETFGELMSTFTNMMKKVHTNGGLYVDGVASDRYN